VHLRRTVLRNAAKDPASIVQEALRRIQKPYKIEDNARGCPLEEPRAVQAGETRPDVEALKSWFEDCLKRVSIRRRSATPSNANQTIEIARSVFSMSVASKSIPNM
jgi:hypothetical protein